LNDDDNNNNNNDQNIDGERGTIDQGPTEEELRLQNLTEQAKKLMG